MEEMEWTLAVALVQRTRQWLARCPWARCAGAAMVDRCGAANVLIGSPRPDADMPISTGVVMRSWQLPVQWLHALRHAGASCACAGVMLHPAAAAAGNDGAADLNQRACLVVILFAEPLL